MRIFSLAAISTPAIAAPAPAARIREDQREQRRVRQWFAFRDVLAATNNQQPAGARFVFKRFLFRQFLFRQR